MSLSQEPVLSILKKHYVVGWKNIKKEDYVGSSHGYTCQEAAVGTTNGAGPRNTQMFLLSPGGVVLHCLPGFWHPEDLAYELELGRVIHRLWKDKRSKKDKRDMFVRFHKRAIRTQSPAMIARSGWQGFDANNERKRLEKGPRDTFYYDQNNRPGRMKPLSVLVHERMIARPFMSIQKFDTAEFIDYGRPYYDNNAGVAGRGVKFGSEGYMKSQKRQAERDKERAARKARSDKYYGKKSKEKDKRRPRKGRKKKQALEKTDGGKRRGTRRAKRRMRDMQRPTSRPTSRPSRRRA